MGAFIYVDIYLYIQFEGERSFELYVLTYTFSLQYTRHMDINARGITYVRHTAARHGTTVRGTPYGTPRTKNKKIKDVINRPSMYIH